MSKLTLATEKYVELSSDIANFILEYSAIDPVRDDEGYLLPDAEDKMLYLTDEVEDILNHFIIKGESIANQSN